MLKAILKNRRGTLFLLLAALALMAYAQLQILGVDAHFQRAYPVPARVVAQAGGGEEAAAGQPSGINSGLRDARLAADEVTKTLEGACEKASLYVVGQPASVSVEDGQSVSARLLGIEGSYFALKQLTLSCGRLIYPDEFLYGERVALVDEQLAVALFRYAEPLGEEIVIGELKFRIVGVVRDYKQVGDEMDYSLYVPYRALEKNSVELTSLIYEASPVKGAGGWSAFESAAGSLGAGGTTISLSKERMNASMPLRLLGVLCGGAVGLFIIRLLNRAFRSLLSRYRQRLRDQYAARLLWWAGWRFALLALGYAACALVLARLFVLLVEPVYTFPEWVPAILVEPKDIQAAFWNVWQKPAAAAEWRTPELLRLRFYRELMGWSAGAAALLTGSLWGRLTQAAVPEENTEDDAE